MSNRMHALAQGLAGKETIDDCSLEEVKHIAQRHPYFAPAQFLLLQKLRQAGTSEEAEAQYRKAVLFFHDPLLFEQFISTHSFNEDEIINSLATAPSSMEDGAKTEIPAAEKPVEHDRNGLEKNWEAEAIDVVYDSPVTEVEPEIPTAEEETAVTPQPTPESSSVTSEEAQIQDKNEEEQLAVASQQPVPGMEAKPTEPVSAGLTFEPFHTVDYFASQGIKISQEELPKDKLGKQLKSFTEWLKTMKRLPATQITDNIESSAERKVESMASHSVSESNVVTEAMAEVWIKQGNIAKALDIYNKLSLQNPSKRAYFAAKIENLKQS